MDIPLKPSRKHHRSAPAGVVGKNPTPAGIIVGRLNSYIIGKTRLTDLYADAGIGSLKEEGKNGWVIASRGQFQYLPDTIDKSAPDDSSNTIKVQVSFHDATYGNASIANLDFKDGVLSVFKWNN